MPEASEIAEKIFARLEELHMSKIELSRRTGIATSTISDWRKFEMYPLTFDEYIEKFLLELGKVLFKGKNATGFIRLK